MESEWLHGNPLICERLEKVAFPLANRFYKQAGEKGKTQGSDEVYVAKLEGKMVAVVRLCPIRAAGESTANEPPLLLRSLAVLPNMRRKGIGHKLMQFVAGQLDERVCWCYPFSWLESFYELSGFQSVALNETPEYIQRPYESYRRQGRDILIMVRAGAACRVLDE